MRIILYAIDVLIQVAALVLVAYFAAAWFLPKGSKARKAFDKFDYRYSSRVFAPVRKYTSRLRFRLPFDLAPLAYILALIVLRSFVAWLLVRA
jgi:uncharacterized protein YggT (Ycf19 family)